MWSGVLGSLHEVPRAAERWGHSSDSDGIPVYVALLRGGWVPMKIILSEFVLNYHEIESGSQLLLGWKGVPPVCKHCGSRTGISTRQGLTLVWFKQAVCCKGVCITLGSDPV